MMTAHHDKSGDIILSVVLEFAWDEHLHNFDNFDVSMAEGNMLMDLETRFDYNQNASERRFFVTFQSLSGQRLRGGLRVTTHSDSSS